MFGYVFFADVLGFSALSQTAGAAPAVDALSDVATVLSDEDEVARFLQQDRWRCRYGMSDSLFLVADQADDACSAAAEFFFSLAFLNFAATDEAVLMRGGITGGEVQEIPPIFPETGKGNLVGEAVVRAVKLEESALKGPRLFVDEKVVGELETNGANSAWLIAHHSAGPAELLWLLPPDPAVANGTMIGSVCAVAVQLFNKFNAVAKVGLHYAGYLELIAQSLERLSAHNPQEASIAARGAGFGRIQLATAASDVRQLLQAEQLVERLTKLTVG